MLNPQQIAEKLDSLETDMERLAAENLRLISERESVYVELDSCVGLISQLAVAQGLVAGTKNNDTVVIDLPVGQVSWDYAPAEAHLFSHLSEYQNPIEEMDAQEKYRRVMNPGL